MSTDFTVTFPPFTIYLHELSQLQVLDWRKRGTADGFSSVNLVLPVLMMGCWLRHGFMTNDFTNMFINTVNLIVFTGYIIAFAFYQPCRRYLCLQLFALFFSLFCIFSYVSWQPDDIAADVMGGIAAAMQIISLGGQIYEIIANFAALLVNIATISLYFIYPPLTWKVPIIGTGPQQKKND
ncbi:Sugar transporter SWEET [Dirofilaria immitis]|nr:Sugar transporter SWEET [Dirofilaria immitis]